jgi:hypothetical protein
MNLEMKGREASLNWRVYRVLAWTGVAVQVVALVGVLFLERWNGAVSLMVFLGLSAAFLLSQDRVPSLLDLLVVVAALVNALGWSFNLFDEFTFYDELVHFFAPFAISATLGYLAWRQRLPGTRPFSAPFLIGVTVAGLVLGIVWEVLELTFVNLTWGDTTVDLVMDTAGAALAGFYVSWLIRRQSAEETTG